jgi:hypothetical protein
LIKSIQLQNYQSHKKTIIEFSPGINCIIGPSDQGKTAILRALYWTVYNRPSGLAYISHWNRDKDGKPIKSTYVKVENDSNIIERRRGKVKRSDDYEEFNGYVINDSEYLEAIGQDVPDEVNKLFNLDSVNIQKQMDAPFLLSESAGEVARFFNQIIRLDLIDKVLSKAESKKREMNKDKIRLENESENIAKEILEYDWIDEAESLANKISKAEDRVNENNGIRDNLILTVTKNKVLIDEISLQEEILSAAPLVNKIKIVQESLEQNSSKYKRLQNLSSQWQEQNDIIKGVADFSSIDLLIEKIDSFRRSIFDKVKVKENLENLTEEYKIKYAGVEVEIEKISLMEKELPQICPYCGNKIKE